jgi:DNA-binding transcriptional ArsR family regulator
VNGGFSGVREHPHELLAVADIDRRPVRVATSVFPTLLAAVDALGGRDADVAPELTRAVARSLSHADVAVLRPVILRPRRFVPTCLLLPAGNAALTPEQELERLQAISADAFVGELQVLDDYGPWAAAARAPTQWLRGYQRAMTRCWHALEPFWTHAAPALELETERVAVALARGVISDLIVAAQPAGAVAGGSIAFPSVRRRVTVSTAGLVLTPKLVGSASHSLRFYDGQAMTHLAYRAPGVERLWGASANPATLVALLGGPRATILRALDRPQSVGELARRLIAVPSAATHHVDALQDAGLVARERQGRQVQVRRTARGSALLALYER